jgi:AcrR family transcriptional regulator
MNRCERIRSMDGTNLGGRGNQKNRTRTAIIESTRALIRSGGEVTMPIVAEASLVSLGTAYRYFPDIFSLLREAIVGLWPTPTEAMEPIETSEDPVQRVAFATEFFLRRALAYQGATRAMLAATIMRPATAESRVGIKFGLIEEALLPAMGTIALIEPEALIQLKRDLAVIVSAEALFCLTDLCHLDPEDAIRSVVRTARTVTEAAFERKVRRPET